MIDSNFINSFKYSSEGYRTRAGSPVYRSVENCRISNPIL